MTLDFWVLNEIENGTTSFYDTLLSDFESAHPNIHIEITKFPEQNYDVKVDTAIAAGRAPDLIISFGSDYARAGLMLPLDDVVAEKGIDLSTYSPAIVGEGGEFSCLWEGKLYCLGSYSGVSAMIYNNEYPAPWPPTTPEEFVDIACRLTDKENGVWGGAAADPLAYLPWEVFVSEDGRTGQGYVNSAATAHQFDVLGRAYAEKCLPSLNVLDPWIQGRDFFAKGSLAMVITDYLNLDRVENAGINYGTTAPPTPAGYEPYFFSWSDTVGVLASSEHPDEAKEFIAYLTTEGQRIRFETTGDIPLDSKVAEEVDWAGGIPGRQDGLEVAAHARAPIFIPNRWDVLGPVWDAWGLIVGGEKPAQQALDDVAPAIQENLDKAWKDWEEQG